MHAVTFGVLTAVCGQPGPTLLSSWSGGKSEIGRRAWMFDASFPSNTLMSICGMMRRTSVNHSYRPSLNAVLISAAGPRFIFADV